MIDIAIILIFEFTFLNFISNNDDSFKNSESVILSLIVKSDEKKLTKVRVNFITGLYV